MARAEGVPGVLTSTLTHERNIRLSPESGIFNTRGRGCLASSAKRWWAFPGGVGGYGTGGASDG